MREEKFYQNVNLKLEKLIKESKMSVIELSKLSKVSTSTIYKIFRNKKFMIKTSTFLRIVYALNIKTDDFFNDGVFERKR